MKPTKILFILLIFLSVSNYCLADSQLILSRSFNILAVNGASYPKGLVTQDRQLSLRNGKNRLVIEYEEVFESQRDDNFDIVKSSPFLLEVYLQQNLTYQQRIVKPASVDAARQFANNPLFEIVAINDQQEQKISFTLTALASDNSAYLLQESRLPPNATIDLSFNPSEKTTHINNSVTEEKPEQSKARQMLDYWWLQATAEERQQFLRSIEQEQ